MLGKKIEQKRKALEELTENESEFETRYSELEEAIEQAEEQEDIDTVEELINDLEEEQEEHNSKKQELEDAIEELEDELRELKEKTPTNNQEEKGSEEMNKQELRDAINTYIRTKGKVQKRDVEGFKVVDGGILVPEELLSPEKKPEDVVDLQKYVRTTSVSSGSGKFPVISKSGSRMNTVAELEENPELAKPNIDEVDFSIDTYRGYIPISQEVIDDADYDIVGLIDEEIQDQGLNTRNYAIAQVLKSAEAEEVEGLDGLITLLNTGFKNAYNIKVYASKSLFNELDLLKDKNGRYLLEDDITVPSGKRIRGKEVIVLDDEVIGENEGDLVGFVGDAEAYARFFDRKRTTADWVEHNIYGRLLALFMRFDVKKVDDDAGKYITFVPGEEEGN